MEESTNEVEANQSFKSPPRRRRSTFFERRESIVPQTLTENCEPNVCKPSPELSNNNDKDLKRYYDKLLVEKEQWKKEVNNRRNKYHDLRQPVPIYFNRNACIPANLLQILKSLWKTRQYQMALKTPGRSRMSYAALSNDDIEFIKAKVSISKLIDSQQKLHQSLKETIALHRRANELDNVILNHCEEKVNKITEYIFENSTIDPKD